MLNLYPFAAPLAPNLVQITAEEAATLRALVPVTPAVGADFLVADVPRRGPFTLEITIDEPFDGASAVLSFALDGAALTENGVALSVDLTGTTGAEWAFTPPLEAGLPANARLTGGLQVDGATTGRARVAVSGNVGFYLTDTEPTVDSPVGIYVVTA